MKQSYVAHCVSGYYSYDRKVLVDKRLNRMPYAQAGIIEKPNCVQLVSYETIVAEIDGEWLHIYGTFSASTRRHIGAFLKEYAPSISYYDAKKLDENDLEMNIKTHETRKAYNGMIQTIGTRV